MLVIIGIIVLISSIFLFSYNSDSISIFNDQSSSYKVKNFVESCLKIQTNEAINKIGFQAGWLYNPYSDKMFASRETNKYLIQNNIGYKDLGGVEFPYWYYFDDTSKNFKLGIPDYDSDNEYSIKNQMKRYLIENLDKNCLNKFKEFDSLYNIKYDSKDITKNLNVIFDKDKVTVKLNLPLKITTLNSENSEYVDSFRIDSKNKLWLPYNLAKDIVYGENKDSFLEYRILDMTNAYKDSSRRDLLPPNYEFKVNTFDLNPWNIQNVEKLFKYIISDNIDLIQFSNTNIENSKSKLIIPKGLEDDEIANSFYNYYTSDYISNISSMIQNDPQVYKNLQVDLDYNPLYPTYFSISNSIGDLFLMPDAQFVGGIIPISFTEYTATYKFTMPVMFEIKDLESKNNDFVFRFPIEVNVDHNSALRNNIDYGINLNSIKKLDNKNTLICNPSQFISDYVYLNISDPVINGQRKYLGDKEYNMFETGINDVMISFTCKNIVTCPLPIKTKINGKYISENITTLKFRLPINCNPGTLELYKHGYQKIVLNNLDPKLDVPINLGKVYMSSKKNLKLRIKLLTVGDSMNTAGKTRLEKEEKGFIMFQNLADENDITVIDFNKDNFNTKNISLFPGNYSVMGYIFSEKGKYLSKEEGSASKGPFQGDKHYSVGPINLTSWIVGSFKSENMQIVLGNLLSNDDTLEIGMIYGEYPECIMKGCDNKLTNGAQILKANSSRNYRFTH